MNKILAVMSAVLVLLAFCACEKTQLPLLDQHPHIDTQYYPDGKTILCETEYSEGGICTKETFYAANGLKTTETFFDESGTRTKRTEYAESGLKECEMLYNESGKCIKITQYAEDGSPAEWTEYEYDALGNVTNQTHYLPDGAAGSSNDE